MYDILKISKLCGVWYGIVSNFISRVELERVLLNLHFIGLDWKPYDSKDSLHNVLKSPTLNVIWPENVFALILQASL